ncbi:MAG: hypothetical protein RBS78_01125 [Coriobacteriia bacterium]|nr:hypothetical protein [Coriobacteriia bacterium]
MSKRAAGSNQTLRVLGLARREVFALGVRCGAVRGVVREAVRRRGAGFRDDGVREEEPRADPFAEVVRRVLVVAPCRVVFLVAMADEGPVRRPTWCAVRSWCA